MKYGRRKRFLALGLALLMVLAPAAVPAVQAGQAPAFTKDEVLQLAVFLRTGQTASRYGSNYYRAVRILEHLGQSSQPVLELLFGSSETKDRQLGIAVVTKQLCQTAGFTAETRWLIPVLERLLNSDSEDSRLAALALLAADSTARSKAVLLAANDSAASVRELAAILKNDPKRTDLRNCQRFEIISAEEFQDLPVFGRDYQAALTLAPGVQDSEGDTARVTVIGKDQVVELAVESSGFKTGASAKKGRSVSNQDPLTNGFQSAFNPDSVEQLEIVDSGADASHGGAVGGFGRIVSGSPQGYNYSPPPNTSFRYDKFPAIKDNPFIRVETAPRSTFSTDVDTASYSWMRGQILRGEKPYPESVRIEEMINYFLYRYPEPTSTDPIAVGYEANACPWTPDHRCLKLNMKAYEPPMSYGNGRNLVFLVDVSGSMDDPMKLPLVRESLKLQVGRLGSNDSVGVVTYAGSFGTLLEPTRVTEANKPVIIAAIDSLEPGGSTNGEGGMRAAYALAEKHFIKGGVNRVILATDGDFNVWAERSSPETLQQFAAKKAKEGVALTILGYGYDNYQDELMQQIAQEANGNAFYIDSLSEAKKVLVTQMYATLDMVAKDVKVQLEFNPAQVGAYRLIGYETRLLKDQDFNDDAKDAGDLGAGHTVTALYELVPPGQEGNIPGVDPLKYQAPSSGKGPVYAELLTVKVRYKLPDGTTSKLLELPVLDGKTSLAQASEDFKFAAAVAAFGMTLRQSPARGSASLDLALQLGAQGISWDPDGYRAEFLTLIRELKSVAILERFEEALGL